MSYALIPLVVVVLATSLTFQAQWRAHTAAGINTRVDMAASVRATQAIAYAAACVDAARQAPGAVAADLAVSLPTGLSAVAGAQCATQASGGGRLVYASVPSAPGAIGELMKAVDGSATWYQVLAPGSAEQLATALRVDVPSTIATGSLLYQIRLTP
ncbi:hypothetical protein [Burkholderia gladioli]|uniref:hypothetical protein n=1 Tax=Burkholderia gladioli TaxID=28095 RepID=UPI00163EC847|nr:hypothetical protein [Burkholderia gladioli]MDN7813781.1 hypothetical protein [Burkholderia gladioli]